MIPIHLSIAGFLSYREPVELDFTTFDLACISGANGAGKSSLLDAITWALFGKARRSDDAIIHTQADQAEVVFTFALESNTYRVQRIKRRNKSTMLEFHIQASEHWKPLTERTMRATQARIEQTLRMDYDTFVNASFFLQGRADQFTQQTPGERKRVLSAILGLGVWEEYRQRAAERRRAVEAEIAALDAQMQEIRAELAEEPQRKQRLAELEAELEAMRRAREAQERALDEARKATAALEGQQQVVQTLARQVEAAQTELAALEERLAARRKETAALEDLLARADEVRAQHRAWEEARLALARWEQVAEQFREQQARREAPMQRITAERARLEQERATLLQQEQAAQAAQQRISQLEAELQAARQALDEAEAARRDREALDGTLAEAREARARMEVENPRLKAEMEELKQRIQQLQAATAAHCPLCGQPLSEDDRARLITQLKAEGKEKGNRYRENVAAYESARARVQELEARMAELRRLETLIQPRTRQVEQLTQQLDALRKQWKEWQQTGAPRLQEVTQALTDEAFAVEARAELAAIDAELKAIGYDPQAHQEARQREEALHAVQEAFRELDRAEARLDPLRREIADLEAQVENRSRALEEITQEHNRHAAALAEALKSLPDVSELEREVLRAQEEENRLNQQVILARQQVAVLDDLRARLRSRQAKREDLARTVDRYKMLERAFGRDGVPALLIEQALPQIENRANEILERLSNGAMHISFITQQAYKDRRRNDLRETLDIQISDSAGVRAYEMYSGGEAFRVNFAIRLALSQVLAHRAGARLQTLVIDEGFGSQDAQGRQRLVEAINAVRQDFAKILVITHIEELKDAFPTRIEVEKTPQGSKLSVH